ncbi:hypothetical protein ABID21_000333 [Pseudorhizobium tarimense]|uniref:DUF1850 domain-containing protein n=1 Tax=Pseudorhizobium tarimense TaxID=1079109 RepID=A0ABV2H120_9HYPH|nr:DUF1850 domain-containing protein [Pseudorhizobium tarimense]MCJ8517562.1 DUF1850 domain-containing protein [Pseudorhizobium tarimense]
MTATIGLCLLLGGKTTVIAASMFTLSWNHSVQKTEWRETWAVTAAGLRLTEAAVESSGAGMEPGANAVLRDGWWVWAPKLPVQPRLTLAASGATGGGWTLCHPGGCSEIGAKVGENVVLTPCP